MNYQLFKHRFLSYSKLSYLASALAGILYCSGLTFGNSIIQNICTIFFIFYLGGLFLINLKQLKKKSLNLPTTVITQLVVLNLSIVITAILIKSPDTFFWVQDSLTSHLPASQKFSDFLTGHALFIDLNLELPGFTTHSLTGLAIALLGKNIFTTVLVQLIFKIITVFFIYFTTTALWKNQTISIVAVQLYGFCPTIYFYNLVLYKESAIQAYMAITIYLTVKIFNNNQKIFIFPLACILYLISKERFYLLYSLLLMLPFFIYDSIFKKQIKVKIKASAFVLFFIILFTVYKYIPNRNYIIELQNYLTAMRTSYASYSDVLNKFNYSIPYPLAVLKIIFSPYFSFNKFKIFSSFSLLLIWGSPINQIIILSSILGFIKAVKIKILHFYLWIPLFTFLLFAAYISPWSGRIRDSFYPLISMYAAFYLFQNKYFKKLIYLDKDESI